MERVARTIAQAIKKMPVPMLVFEVIRFTPRTTSITHNENKTTFEIIKIVFIFPPNLNVLDLFASFLLGPSKASRENSPRIASGGGWVKLLEAI